MVLLFVGVGAGRGGFGEPVRSHAIQSFVYRGVYYFTKPPEQTVWLWCGLEVNQFLSYNRPLTETATGGVLEEKVFLEIWQNSQENTCARVISCGFCKISNNSFSNRITPVAASVE